MYEEKPKKSLNNLNINWKSLLIKLVILLVAVFVLIWLISLVSKDKKTVESNLATNLQSMKTAAMEYYTGSRLPSNINGRKKITLNEMFESKLLVEFKDQNNKACDGIDSYAEATKINSTDYTIKVKLVCGSESDYVIDTVSFKDDIIDNPVIDNGNNVIDNTQNNVVDNTNNNSNINNTTNNTNTTTNKNNSSTKKPSSSNSSKNNIPIKNVTTKPNSNNNSNSTTNNTVANNTCTYGKKDYLTTYTLAYIVPGNCAVSPTDYYKAEYVNAVNYITGVEYQKLSNEISALKARTGANLYLETPNYFGVYNKDGKGLVGYQMLFTVKQKVNYAVSTVYQYYLDANGNRKVVIDKRNSITSSGNNSNNNNNNNNNNSNTNTRPTTIRVTSVSLNRTSITLDVSDTYYLTATINPSNATNKTITWTSSNTNVATVNAAGRVKALRAGSATITATVDGKKATARVYVNEEETIYRYCKTDRERVYSTNYVNVSEIGSRTNFTYQVALTANNYNFYDVEYGNLATNYDYAMAYNYWTNKNKPLSFVSGSTGSGSISAPDHTYLANHALKSYNFTPTVTYVKRSGNRLYFNINVRLKNLNYIDSATPYYPTSNRGVYFLPLYFDVVTINYGNCASITSSQVNSYVNNGYVKVN